MNNPTDITDVFEDDLNDSWKTTYMDLVTLLLCFFILLLSMSSLNQKKIQRVFGSINYILKGKVERGGLPTFEDKGGLTGEENALGWQEENLIMEFKMAAAKNEQIKNNLSLNVADGRIILKVNNNIMFASGVSEINKNAYDILDFIVLLLNRFPDFKIHIQGHTDSSPISNSTFPSNWELSGSRATSVLRYFLEKDISPKRITAVGYADLFPITSNDNEIGKSINRRVEFVLEAKK